MATPVKVKALVTRVVKHTPSVVSYQFAPQGRVPKFHAGQFLHLTLDDYQPDSPWPESRVFSIASSPAERASELAVTISVKGRYTERIFNTLEESSACWLKLPYGEFLFPSDRHLVLIAGGVGITPFLSLFKQMLEDKSSQAVSLCYGVRAAEHYLFGDLLSRCEAELPNFAKTVYCEDGTLPGHKGILDIAEIYVSAPEGALFYLSGPPAMINVFRKRLGDFGVTGDRVRVDDWE
ncbi:MAG TPA: FAD-dependent oxidoreductase [Kiritimatiellia bacterium]|nr:FAD-dependent oxidoreductase [Kiritimatiellia bacterium]HPS07008.1 FAD-dependent oxidoreductase [Kiritimatiellia bacterium]